MKRVYYLILISIFSLQVISTNHVSGQIFGSGADPNNFAYKGQNFTAERENAITKYTPYFRAVLLLIGIIGMVGAFRIYVKWQQGDDVYRNIVRWFMAGLSVPIAYVIFSKFFFNT
ncbi:uncharacterized protein DUF4134 [Arcicella aurantiaca]|uniref:Uncharacterized protein DUF4134 n=1 Tax=Arcicella aurantiaca TaxID=591202 RepID=A0A316DGQ5_9BACT|nr:DUF4134 family protein [Arcicella aurantiaca]PWK16798.1 uncharacterized protein DUF4134 [Arcicella aurantiaca]